MQNLKSPKEGLHTYNRCRSRRGPVQCQSEGASRCRIKKSTKMSVGMHTPHIGVNAQGKWSRDGDRQRKRKIKTFPHFLKEGMTHLPTDLFPEGGPSRERGGKNERRHQMGKE